MTMIEVNGQGRFALGWLRYPRPPEPGTILGPHPITREWMTVLLTDADGRTWLTPSTTIELDSLPEYPRSLTEIALAGRLP